MSCRRASSAGSADKSVLFAAAAVVSVASVAEALVSDVPRLSSALSSSSPMAKTMFIGLPPVGQPVRRDDSATMAVVAAARLALMVFSAAASSVAKVVAGLARKARARISSLSGVRLTRPAAAVKPCSLPMVADSTSSMQGSSCARSTISKRPPPSVVALAGKPALHLAVTTLPATAAPVAARPVRLMGVMSLPPQLASKVLIAATVKANFKLRTVSPGIVLGDRNSCVHRSTALNDCA